MAHVHETRTDGGSGVASGMVLGIVLVLLVLALAAFAFFGGAFRGAPSTTPAQPRNDTNIQVNPPAAPPKVDVNINQPSQQAPAPQAPSKP
jgi:hypothetical protein